MATLFKAEFRTDVLGRGRPGTSRDKPLGLLGGVEKVRSTLGEATKQVLKWSWRKEQQNFQIWSEDSSKEKERGKERSLRIPRVSTSLLVVYLMLGLLFSLLPLS